MSENGDNEALLDAARKVIISDRYRAVKALLTRRDDTFINRVREAFEADDVGRRIVAKHPDRHLYAVLKPMRRENFRRLDNAFFAMPQKMQITVLRAALKDNQAKI